HRHPVQPRPQGVLRPPGQGRQAQDAGRRCLHAQAGDDLLRGAQEPHTVRPRLGLNKDPLTTCHLVRHGSDHESIRVPWTAPTLLSTTAILLSRFLCIFPLSPPGIDETSTFSRLPYTDPSIPGHCVSVVPSGPSFLALIQGGTRGSRWSATNPGSGHGRTAQT